MGSIRKFGKEPKPTQSRLAVHIGKTLNDLRERDQVAMRTVAKGACLSDAFICQVENGQSVPSAETLWKLAKYFKVSIDYFFQGYEEVCNKQVGYCANCGCVIHHLEIVCGECACEEEGL